jgi:hypothetical protein
MGLKAIMTVMNGCGGDEDCHEHIVHYVDSFHDSSDVEVDPHHRYID